MNYSTKIYLRTGVIRKSGLFPVYLRVIINRRKKEYFLGIYIPKNLWDEKGITIKRSFEYPYENMNAALANIKMKLNRIERDAIIQEHKITISEFDRLFSRKIIDDGSFYSYAQNFLEEKKHKFSTETMRTYDTQISKMKRFRPELKMADLDENFLLQYERYILETLKNSINTHYKTMGFIKTIYRQALEDGLVKEGIFRKFPLTKKDGNREFLKMEELKHVEALIDTDMPKYLLNVTKYFVFACHTGLRYTDMKNLRFGNIIGGITLQIKMHKTKDIVTVPLTNIAKKLIGEPGLPNQKVFKVACNQVTNRYLKIIMKRAGIAKSISFHCARHTFATCSIDLGMPLEIISKLLGHKKLVTTQIYAKILDSVKIREMYKWNE